MPVRNFGGFVAGRPSRKQNNIDPIYKAIRNSKPKYNSKGLTTAGNHMRNIRILKNNSTKVVIKKAINKKVNNFLQNIKVDEKIKSILMKSIKEAIFTKIHSRLLSDQRGKSKMAQGGSRSCSIC